MSEQENTPSTSNANTEQQQDDSRCGKGRRCCGHRHERRCCGPRRWIKLLVILAVVGGIVAWHHHSRDNCRIFSHNTMSPAVMQEHVGHVTARAMDAVEATPAQRDKVNAITRSTVDDLQPLIAAHRAARASLYSALSAETLDPAQIEQLRSDMVQRIDSSSRRITSSVTELGQVLSASQRRELVSRWQQATDM